MSTPYMNLTLPVPTVTLGPEWAEELNAALEVVDEHDHSPGKGALVPATGLDINDNLSIQSNELTDVDTVKMDDHVAVKTGLTDIRNIYPVNGDLYYNNNSGVAVQLTSGNSIATPSSPVVPAGIISAYAGVSAPSGYLLCDGSEVSQATYSDLFAAIGTTYNTGGEGVGNFRLPNALGRVLGGVGTYTDPVSGSVTRTLAQSLGAAEHVLITNEIPAHNHTVVVTDPGHAHSIVASDTGGAGSAQSPSAPTDGAIRNQRVGGTLNAVTGISATTQNSGGGLAHNNMQPTLFINYIIKT